MSVDEWADAYRYLSPESSAEPGKFSTSRAPYQRGPMEALSDPRVKQVVLMWASQLGKTEIPNNFIGKRIHLDPGPILMLQPTLSMGEAWSKDRLSPMLRDTPVLHGRVSDARSRVSDNTLLHKKFPGGHLTIAGANSPAGLASRPIRDVLCDEVDRYPASAGTEGDPIGLAFRRASTFRNGKKLMASSPTIKGQSRIEAEWLDSTREQWLVPCPHCGYLQVLRWGGRDIPWGLHWEPGRPETAHYVCGEDGPEKGSLLGCGAVIEEAHKGYMNAHGDWVAENPGHPTTRGFRLNALVSPWAAWTDLVREFLVVKTDPIRFRQFVNTVWCETWEDDGSTVEKGVLEERLGRGYPKDPTLVPAGVAVLTRSVDVQGDRLETAVWGWGEDEEAWLIEHELIPGDPATPAPWAELAERIAKPYPHETGVTLRPAVTLIDSGGHHSKEVYTFTRAHVRERVYAIKGSSLEGHALLGRPTRNNSAKAILFAVGSFTGKESIVARFVKVKEPGPKYIHLPAWLDGEQLAQFTNEKLVTRFVGGRPKRIWIKTGRNEQLDLAVYALAALQALGPATVRNLGGIAKQLAEQGTALKAQEAAGTASEAASDSADDPPDDGGYVRSGMGPWQF
jgi:phage terminase large subunit GpA-like protein